MNIESETIQDAKPLIKQPWLRIVLYLFSLASALCLINHLPDSYYNGLYNFTNLGVSYDSGNNCISNIFDIIYYLIILLITILFRKFIDKKSIISLGLSFKKFNKDFLLGILIGIGILSLGFLWLYAFGFIREIKFNFDIRILVNGIILYALIGFTEELCYRGYLYQNLNVQTKRLYTLIITSILFFLAHCDNPNIGIIPMLNILIAGFMLGIYTYHKQNIWLPIGLHFSWNFFQGTIYGFNVSGFHNESLFSFTRFGNYLITGGNFGFEGSLLATLLMLITIFLLHRHFQKKDYDFI
jgi:membrane protease YdiL (CAAX protease family)